MIKRLRLENFRRHAEVELDFDDDAQVILVSGPNGAGKSSILEAITYALYGQGRNGRSNVDNLVRRGAELEGMQVEMEFQVAGTSYRVIRRRDNGLSTASLYANENGIAVGAGQVTAEISKILGMDAAGFKLGAIAQQKELDGLASLRPAVRGEQIRRLLRLDALTAAADQARKTFRTEREIATALAGSADFAELENQLKNHEKIHAAAKEALVEATSSIEEIQNSLNETKELEETWKDSQFKQERARALKESLEKDLQQIQDALAEVIIPQEAAEATDISELTARVAEVERALAKAEHAAQLKSQKDMLAKEIANSQNQIAALEASLEESKDAQKNLESVSEEIAKAEEGKSSLSKRLEKSRQEKADWVSQEKIAKVHLENAQELGATCSTCGQLVSDQHKETELKFARIHHAKALKESARWAKEVDELNAELAALDALMVKSLQERRALESAISERKAQLEKTEDLIKRKQNYQSQYDRIDVVEENADDLYAQKAQLAIKVSQAQQAMEAEKKRAQALVRKSSLEKDLERIRLNLLEAEEELLNARPSPAVEEAHSHRISMIESLEEERAMRSHWETQVAVTDRDVQATLAAIESAKEAETKRKEHQSKAITAANASSVLKDVAEKLTSQIRPSLEGSVGQLLGTLSEGRFSKVSIDADYNIKVEDDGKMHPLTEFSGGEMDLIALAMRLAIAQVVTERHGAGGTGFLILDEVFGSQDGERRESILTALRALRASYGQILLISHVGGLEDSADMVIEVTRGQDVSSQVRTLQ